MIGYMASRHKGDSPFSENHPRYRTGRDHETPKKLRRSGSVTPIGLCLPFVTPPAALIDAESHLVCRRAAEGLQQVTDGALEIQELALRRAPLRQQEPQPVAVRTLDMGATNRRA